MSTSPRTEGLAVTDDLTVAEAAREYAERGFRVVIVHGVTFPPDLDGAPSCTCPDPRPNGQAGGARCDSKGKHPRFKGWQDDAGDTDPEAVARWFDRYPESNVGLPMGGAARLVALDIDGPAGEASVAELERKLGALPPTLTSRSGRADGGTHRIFRLPESFDLAAVKNRAGKLGAGLDVRAEGGQVVVSPSLHASGGRYAWLDPREPAPLPDAWAELLTAEPAAAPPPPPPPPPAPAPRRRTDARAFTWPRRYARIALDEACKVLAAAPKGTRNDTASAQAFAVGGLLHAGAYDEAEALRTLLAATHAGGWDQDKATLTEATLRRQLAEGAKEPRDIPEERPREPASRPTQAAPDLADPLDPSERPRIRIIEHEIPRMVTEAIGALAADRNLYQRAAELVTITREPERQETEEEVRAGNDILMRPGTPRLRTLHGAVMFERMAIVADWEKFDGRSGKWKLTAPHDRVASIVHKRQNWPGIRPVRGIIEAPSLRPDGSIIYERGYDPATGFILLPSCDFPAVADAPTQEEAAAALRRLWTELCADFPYRGMGEVPEDWRTTDPDRWHQYERARAVPDAFVGIAALLTMVARPAILGACPGIIFEASTQGSGKTLQIHTVAVAATGRPAGVMTFPAARGVPNEEELEKVLGAYALAGARIIAFDNVKANLSGPGLEKALTSVDTIDLRVLGASDMRTMPWAAIVLFSGNNMSMSDDVAQRVLVSRLESPREDPRSRPARDFYRTDLLGSIRERRPALVADALTILRAFSVAPSSSRPATGTWGSFEAWSALIPPAIAYAGGPNVLDVRPKTANDGCDDEAEAHLTLMRQWPCQDPAKAGDVIAALFAQEDDIRRGKTAPDGRDITRAAVRTMTHSGEFRPPNLIAFGKALRKLKGKIRGGLKIECRDNSAGSKDWWVDDTINQRSHTAQALDPYAD